MGVPTVAGTGAVFSSAGGANATCNLPAHLTNDILLIFLQNYSNSALTFNQNTAGFVEFIQTGGTNRSIHVCWVRATSSTMTNPSITCPTNHQIGASVAIRGCPTTGNPWNTSTSSDFAATSSWSWDAVETTQTDCLAILIGGAVRDNTGGWMGALTNANLTSITELVDDSVTTNAGGGIFAASASITTIQNTGNTTGTAAGSYAGDVATIAFLSTSSASSSSTLNNTTDFFLWW